MEWKMPIPGNFCNFFFVPPHWHDWVQIRNLPGTRKKQIEFKVQNEKMKFKNGSKKKKKQQHWKPMIKLNLNAQSHAINTETNKVAVSHLMYSIFFFFLLLPLIFIIIFYFNSHKIMDREKILCFFCLCWCMCLMSKLVMTRKKPDNRQNNK